MLSNSQVSERSIRYKWSPFSRSKVLEKTGVLPIVRGEGSTVFDIEGRSYLDCHAALWLANVGYGRKEITEAVSRQMDEIAWFSSFEGYTTIPSTDLAEKLVTLMRPEGMEKVFFSNSGSEANDTAFKMVRQYWKMRGQPQRYKIIARERSYHGVTFGGLSATGLPANRKMFEPLVPGFSFAACPDTYRLGSTGPADDEAIGRRCADDFERLIQVEGPETVAAIIVEPVQGAGGVIIPPPGYLARVREICDNYGILLIFDEVITGFGRTGEWFGARKWNVNPDLMVLAKGITSGYLPLGATMVSGKIFEHFRDAEGEYGPFRHGNTYSGHPTTCAAGLANIAIMERENLPGNALKVGARLFERLKRLESHPNVGQVVGVGLLGRIQLVSDKASRAGLPAEWETGDRIVAAMRQAGVIVRALPFDAISLSPPLCLTASEADQIADAFIEVVPRVMDSVARQS